MNKLVALAELARFHACPRVVRDAKQTARLTYLHSIGPVEADSKVSPSGVCAPRGSDPGGTRNEVHDA